MGRHEQAIVKQAMRFGQPIPDRIAEAPELRIGLQVYFQGFFDLDSERERLSPIPWTAMKAYCQFNEFDDEETDDFIYLIRKMDSANLERLAKKNG